MQRARTLNSWKIEERKYRSGVQIVTMWICGSPSIRFPICARPTSPLSPVFQTFKVKAFEVMTMSCRHPTMYIVVNMHHVEFGCSFLAPLLSPLTVFAFIENHQLFNSMPPQQREVRETEMLRVTSESDMSEMRADSSSRREYRVRKGHLIG